MRIVLKAPSVNFQRILLTALLYLAAASLFANLANAPGQLYLGRLYYLKDAAMIFSFFAFAGLAWMRQDKLALFVLAANILLLLVFIPAMRVDDTPGTGLTIGWILRWGVAAQAAILIVRERLAWHLRPIIAALLGIIAVDAAIGLGEIRSQSFFFDMSGLDQTAAGIAMVKQEQVEDLIRVLSMHRSGGDFGNSMATGILLSLFFILSTRRRLLQAVLIPFVLLCAYDLFFSTLRSFLVGTVAGSAALLLVLFLPRVFGRIAGRLLLGMTLVFLFFSYFNIIPMVEFISRHVLSDIAIGDVNSSYMRLDTWTDVFANIRTAPIVALIGGPLAAAAGLDVPANNICDNTYLWIFYHLGIFGFLGVFCCLPLPLARCPDIRLRALYFAAATQLLTTGIFTDSFFYFSSLLFFFVLGTILAEMTTLPVGSVVPGALLQAALAQQEREDAMRMEPAGTPVAHG